VAKFDAALARRERPERKVGHLESRRSRSAISAPCYDLLENTSSATALHASLLKQQMETT